MLSVMQTFHHAMMIMVRRDMHEEEMGRCAQLALVNLPNSVRHTYTHWQKTALASVFTLPFLCQSRLPFPVSDSVIRPPVLLFAD